MWRIFNFLFGWDYVQWRNTSDQGIARVRVDHSGKVYYYRYAFFKIIDVMTHPKHYVWLTCSPMKYFPPDDDFEFICKKCGLRQDNPNQPEADF